MSFRTLVIPAQVATALALLLSASLATTQTVTVSNLPSGVTFTFTDTTANPDPIQNFDWGQAKFFANGTNGTSVVIGLIGTPLVTVAIRTNAVSLTINADLTSLAIGASICYKLTVNGGSCADSFVRLRDSFCFPSTACTAGGRLIGTRKASQGYHVSPFVFNDAGPRAFVKFPAIVRTGSGATPTWSSLTWKYNIWTGSTVAAAAAVFHGDRLNGNYANGTLRISGTPKAWGAPADNQWLVELVPSTQIFVSPGPKLVSLRTDNTLGLNTVESTKNLGSNYVATHFNTTQVFRYIPDLSPPYTTGTGAQDVIGY